MREMALQAVLAVPVLLFEILFVYLWFNKFYLSKRGITIQQYKKRIRDFLEYRNRIRTGKIRPSLEMENFLNKNQTIYKFAFLDILVFFLILYIFGIVCMIFFCSVTEAMWKEYSFLSILFAWFIITVVAIVAFVQFWKEGKRLLITKLEQYTEFLLAFMKLLKEF